MINIAGYQFTDLNNLSELQHDLLSTCQKLALKGTIYLSHEGININLCGDEANIAQFKKIMSTQPPFTLLTFRESFSETSSFKRLKVKLKKEIISLHQPTVNVIEKTAPRIKPEVFKKWLDEKRDMLILDTRNDYEIRFGTFDQALNLGLNHFHEFPHRKDSLVTQQPIVMFCTGGIRCEKAASYLMNHGFDEIYQLEGGILNYFAAMGGAHYNGECFVFDDRVSLNPSLSVTGTRQCSHCQGPVTIEKKDCSACES